jgi:hypothetical protein
LELVEQVEGKRAQASGDMDEQMLAPRATQNQIITTAHPANKCRIITLGIVIAAHLVSDNFPSLAFEFPAIPRSNSLQCQRGRQVQFSPGEENKKSIIPVNLFDLSKNPASDCKQRCLAAAVRLAGLR